MKYLDDSMYRDNPKMICEVMDKIREFMNCNWSDEHVDEFYMNHCYIETEESIVEEYEDYQHEYNLIGIYSAEDLKLARFIIKLSDGNYLFIV